MSLISSREVGDFHDRCLTNPVWPNGDVELSSGNTSPARIEIWRWITENHRNNCRLWAEEDLARRTQVSDADIAANKRAIDRFNQARNDATERIDELLLIDLKLVNANSAQTDSPIVHAMDGARLNSETAGSMVDRMSILALKIRAMRDQTTRTDVSPAHRLACQSKLQKLMEQRGDLGVCLDTLLAHAEAGLAYFKVYRQFKMYNDPNLNPALVAENKAGA